MVALSIPLDRFTVRDLFVRAVRKFARGRTLAGLYDALDERDVPGPITGLIADVARGDRRAAKELVDDAVPNVGAGWSTVDDVLATARLFAALLSTPTLAVHIGSGFRDRPP